MRSWEQVEMIEEYGDLCNGYLKIPLDFSREEKHRISDLAHRRGMTLNEYISLAVSEACAKMKPEIDLAILTKDLKTYVHKLQKMVDHLNSELSHRENVGDVDPKIDVHISTLLHVITDLTELMKSK